MASKHENSPSGRDADFLIFVSKLSREEVVNKSTWLATRQIFASMSKKCQKRGIQYVHNDQVTILGARISRGSRV
jgi:hypothetical protein